MIFLSETEAEKACLAALRDTLLPKLISGELRLGGNMLDLSTENYA
jgi:hypothetical protein